MVGLLMPAAGNAEERENTRSPLSPFGEWLEKARGDKTLTQIGRAIESDYNTVYRYVTGRRTVTPQAAAAIGAEVGDVFGALKSIGIDITQYLPTVPPGASYLPNGKWYIAPINNMSETERLILEGAFQTIEKIRLAQEDRKRAEAGSESSVGNDSVA